MSAVRGDLLLSAPTKLVGVDGSAYLSGAVLERKRMAVTPEFDTESVSGMALLFDGASKANIKYDGIDKLGEVVDFTANAAIPFDTTTDYKADVRFNGRFLNYRIESQSGETTLDWNLTGYQIQVSKGGSR
tara:strand:- start:1212 stop:1604 length:393 start_codon:yes stop_codon:yes gene_type:complete